MVLQPDLEALIKSTDLPSQSQDQPSIASLTSELSTGDITTCEVYVCLHDKYGTTQSIQDIAQLLSIAPKAVIDERFGVLRLTVKKADIPRLAKVDNVRSIEEVPIRVFQENIARGNIGFIAPQDALASINHTLFGNDEARRVKESDYRGGGEMIVVADSGLDRGKKEGAELHPAFTGRVYRIDNYMEPDNFADKHGHGTHVAAIAMGNAESKEFGRIEGTAPEARLWMQKVRDDKKNVFNTGATSLSQLFMLPYSDDPGAAIVPRIHSNSWGPTWLAGKQVADTYNATAQVVDGTARENLDYCLIFAAGTEAAEATSTKSTQIEGAAAAKNGITVGATESSRKMKPMDTYYKYDNGGKPGNPNNVAVFSSRGPTREGRIKPDVVAPGCTIYSARSQYPEHLVYAMQKNPDKKYPFQFWQDDFHPDYDLNGRSPDTLWWFRDGTSQSAPAVAGCCAVLRRVFRTARGVYPTSAMVKALLVHGAIDCYKAEVDKDNLEQWTRIYGQAPNGLQGFGRVFMPTSFRPITTQNAGCYDSIEFLTRKPWTFNPAAERNKPLAPEQEWRQQVQVPNNGTLTITMAYTDREGPQLLNVLGLKVELQAPAGAGAGAGAPPQVRWAEPNPADASQPQVVNNVQKLIWEQIPAGMHTIVVRFLRAEPSQNPKQDFEQHFAVCWTVD